MAARTLEEQLEEVQEAISQVLTRGQAVGENGRALTRADLGRLEAREQRLLKEIRRQHRAPRRPRYGVPR